MFSSLRQDSLLYVLNKREVPSLAIGRVVSVSAPAPKYPTTFVPTPNGLETTIDITVSIDGSNTDFKKVPSQLSIYGDNGIVISESREAMNAEIEAMQSNSRKIIDSVETHRKIIDSCSDMLVTLNPSIAKEKEQEAKIDALESKIGGIEAALSEMNGMLKKLTK